MTEFDESGPALDNDGIFGLPFDLKQSQLVLIPVPWEATTSYGGGTSRGPEAIRRASLQIDLFDIDLKSFYRAGIFMEPASKDILLWNKKAKLEAQKIIKSYSSLKKPNKQAVKKSLETVDSHSARVNNYVYEKTKSLLNAKKKVGLVGGDHSTPYGCIKAHLEKFPHMGILHIDAHADLRIAYEGFKHSHASIMYNVMNDLKPSKLVQVGIRDFCKQEFEYIQASHGKIVTFFDENLKKLQHSGKSWADICSEITSHLPEEVYVSFDIDGLDPKLCPHTGTPVPGGLEFQEALTLIKTLVSSGKKIIGFDLNEVAPGKDEWDANVGARMLFKLCGWTLHS